MATYEELHTLAGQNVLLERIAVAITVSADAILAESDTTPNHANRYVWARQAFIAPEAHAKPILHALLAANKDTSVAQIEGATDATIQARVDAVVNLFAGA